MRKYLTEYRNYIKSQLENENCNYSKLADEALVKIGFFQHERIVHLLVTILFALMTLATLIAFVITRNIGLLVLCVLFVLLLIPYIRHYYFLENETQRLYKDYDKIITKRDKSDGLH